MIYINPMRKNVRRQAPVSILTIHRSNGEIVFVNSSCMRRDGAIKKRFVKAVKA